MDDNKGFLTQGNFLSPGDLPWPQPCEAAKGPKNARTWAEYDKTYAAVSAASDKLPPGLYRCSESPSLGPVLVKQDVSVDNLLLLPDTTVDELVTEFAQFWQLKAEFSSRGFVHKRGFLMWGPPGSGKTSALWLMMKRLIDDHQGIVVMIDHPGSAAKCLQMLRKIEPERPAICVFEDLDALVKVWGENEYLALLDGEAQIDNVVYVATTNYPELLDKRFVDRPSRFDTIRKVDMPSKAARRMYLQHKEPTLKAKELEQWLELSDGFSIAHLKEMIIATKCFKRPVQEVAERLRKMQRVPTSQESKGALGFLGGLE